MKLGVAGMRPGREEHIRIAKKLGYSFIETGLANLESSFTEEQIGEFAAFLSEVGMPCISTNGMFPGDIRLIGPGADKSLIADYLCRAFEKTAPLNTEVCVLGSGAARRIPEGYDSDRAYEEFAVLLEQTVLPVAGKYGKTIAIEPLNRDECNIVNTVAESMSVVRRVNNPRLMTLIDYYHVRKNGEDVKSFAEYRGFIRHVHVSSYNLNRRYPRADDGEDYRGFFDVLRKADYTYGNISIEAGFGKTPEEFEVNAAAAYECLSCLL